MTKEEMYLLEKIFWVLSVVYIILMFYKMANKPSKHQLTETIENNKDNDRNTNE